MIRYFTPPRLLGRIGASGSLPPQLRHSSLLQREYAGPFPAHHRHLELPVVRPTGTRTAGASVHGSNVSKGAAEATCSGMACDGGRPQVLPPAF